MKTITDPSTYVFVSSVIEARRSADSDETFAAKVEAIGTLGVYASTTDDDKPIFIKREDIIRVI